MKKVTVIDIRNAFGEMTCAYGSKIMKPSREILLYWHERFKDYDSEWFKKAVRVCIDTREFPPSIADVKKKYKELTAAFENERKTLSMEWKQIVSWYPSDRIDDKANPYLGHIVMRYKDEEDRLRFMQDMKLKIIDYVQNFKGSELPLLSDLIKELAYGKN